MLRRFARCEFPLPRLPNPVLADFGNLRHLGCGLRTNQAGRDQWAGSRRRGRPAVAAARVEVQPVERLTSRTIKASFFIGDLPPGEYTVPSHTWGSPLHDQRQGGPGQTARLDAPMKVATATEQVLVSADRGRGEAEAIIARSSRQHSAGTSGEVITSLPNTNIATPWGRLPALPGTR